MNDYTNVVMRVQAGDAQAKAELFNLVQRDYYNMVSGIPDSAVANGIFQTAFALTIEHINEVGDPDVYGEWFRMTLEQNINSMPNAGQNISPQAQQGMMGDVELQNMQQDASQFVQQDPYQQMPYGSAPETPKEKKSKVPIIICTIAAVIVVLAIVTVIFGPKLLNLIRGFDKKGYEEVIDKYFEAYSDEDMDTMVACYPKEIGEEVRESFINQSGGDTEQDYWDIMEAGYGEDFEITVEIEEVEVLSPSDLDELEEDANDEFDVDYDFRYGVKLDLSETASGSLYEYTFSESVYMVVMDKEWYVVGTIY